MSKKVAGQNGTSPTLDMNQLMTMMSDVAGKAVANALQNIQPVTPPVKTTEKKTAKSTTEKSSWNPTVTIENYKGNPTIVLRGYEKEKYPFGFGAKKAFLILKFLPAIKSFAEKHPFTEPK